MKKICILFLSLFIITLTVFSLPTFSPKDPAAREYLRIHIRANSDSAEDQAVKYLVRDSLVDAVTPWVAACETKDEAMAAVKSHEEQIASVCTGVLEENGFFYGARAEVRRERFPTRVYEEYTLKAGEYDALVVELGSGEGQNWWCCIYPPLCFTPTGAGNIRYRSKIAEIIETFFKK